MVVLAFVAQRRLYRQLALTCLRATNCDGVTFWGFTDAHSWITENQSAFPGQGAAHPTRVTGPSPPTGASTVPSVARRGRSLTPIA